MLFPTLKQTKNWCKKKIRGGGGVEFFFFRKTILSHFTFYAIFYIKKNTIEKCPFTCWLNGRWFLQIVDGDSWNLYPLYPLFLCYLPRRRRPGTGDIATPPVRLSVTFSFRTVTQKRIAVFSRNFADTCTKSWGCAV